MARPKKSAPNHSSGMYCVRVKVGENFDGSPIRKAFYSNKSKADAKRKAEEYKVNIAVQEITGESVGNNSPQFEVWAKKTLDLLKGTVKDSTYSLTFKNSINNHLIPYFGKRRLDDIKPFHIQEYFNQKGKKLALETLMKHKMSLNRIFETAVDNDMCRKSPLRNINISSKIKPMEKEVYTLEETNLILEYAKSHRFGLAIIIMLEYGLSRSEVLGLKWSDVDHQELTLSISRGIADVISADTGIMAAQVGETKNIYRNREIPISQEVSDLIKQAPTTVVVGRNKKRGIAGKVIKSEYIIHNKDGNYCSPSVWSKRRYNVFMNEMQAYYASQEKPIQIAKLPPHCLRHTRATLWVNEGKNLYAIAKMLGHTDLEMISKRYGHSNAKDLRKLLDI